jgi:hypothetical protein
MHALMAGSIFLKDHTGTVVYGSLHIHIANLPHTIQVTIQVTITYHQVIVQNAHRESNQVLSH